MVAEVFPVDEPSYGNVVRFPPEKNQVEAEFTQLCCEMPVVIPPFCFLVGLWGDYGCVMWQWMAGRLIQPRLISEPLNRTMIRKTFFSRQVIFPVPMSK